MELLERYLNEVKKSLPKKEKVEIINELRSSIMDEYDQADGTPETMEKILLKMGSPIEIAGNYQSRPILSKEIEPLYLMLIKIVSLAVTLGLTVATLTTVVFGNEEFSTGLVVTALALALPDIIMAVITSIGMVTIIVFIADRKLDIKPKQFALSDLPKLPKNEKEVSMVTEGFKIFFSMVFVILINLNINPTMENTKIFADISVLLTGLSILILIDVVFSSISIIKGTQNNVLIRFIQLREIANAALLAYASTIDIFNPALDVIPMFTRYIVRLVFLALAIVTVVNALKTKVKE